jgi:ATP-binding cassette, subfamily F, member 3
LLLDPPNLLLMDEPTTHLDMSSIDALLYALDQFQGTLVFISHDVYFIQVLANHVVHVNAGRLTHYSGGYQYYLDKTKAQSARAALTAGAGGAGCSNPAASGRREFSLSDGTPSLPNRKEQKRREAEERQARSRERKARQQVVHRLEKEIHELEQRQAQLAAELEQPETYQQPGRALAINRDLTDVQHRLSELTPQWEEAATKLSAMESV